MEIINCIGSSSSGLYGSKRTLLKLKKQRSFSGRFKRKNSLFSDFSVPVPSVSLSRIKGKVFRKEFLFKVAACAAFCSIVPYFVYNTISHFQSYASPLKMELNYDTETEILRAAMAKLAMENSEVMFDDFGNLLADDGSVLTSKSVGIGIPVSYQSYKVKSGEVISTIARKFGLTNISTLIAVNGIDNVRALRAGQKLRIPNQDGITYTVVRGDSLNSLSVKFHVAVEELLDVNDLSSRNLSIGQELFIPGAKMDSSSLKKAMGELFINPISASYRLTSRFGPRMDPITGVPSNHKGIDMACPTGTPISAAMSGKIAYVGCNNIYGNYVIINHGNGYQTLYGHMSKTLCRSGQVVGQGTRIGLVGSTGYSTGPHLHFTVYKNGDLVDPLTLIKR